VIRRLMLASAAVLALPSAAMANDGFYVGASIGVGQGQGTADWSVPNVWDTSYSTSPVTGNSTGFAIGALAGFDWGVGNSTWGIVADYHYLSGGETRGAVWEECGSSCTGVLKLSSQGLISIRGRYGFNVADGTMLYATAGFGWIDMNNNLNVGDGKGGNFHANSWEPAIVVGGGLEQRVNDNFSIAGEVLYARTDTIAQLPLDTSYFDSDTPVYYSNSVVIATFNVIWHMN